MKDFLKIKLETSKWKDDFKTVEEYKECVERTLGIKLENVKENPGRRQVAKICLNSLWKKFGQRLNMKQSEYVTDTKRFYEILLDG